MENQSSRGRAVRKRICWIVLIAGVAAPGCFGPAKRTASGDKAGDKIPPAPIPKLNTESPATLVKGLLAGQVIDKFDRKVPRAAIQLVELRDSGQAGAPLEVQANEQGYFTIPGLDPNATYQLTARVAEGDKVVMVGSTIKRPPDPRVLIKISEDYVSPATTRPAPAPAADPPKAEPRPETGAGASLTPPMPMTPETPPETGKPPAEEPVADPPAARTPRPDLKIEIPTRRSPPPLSVPPLRVGLTSAPGETVPYSSQPLPVPSCIMLTSRQIDNFALMDTSGKPWELRKDRKGRLVLLDFWHTKCPPCLRAIPHLNELHQTYGPGGLEVVGVAYEEGAADQRLTQVLAARSRFDIRYRTLMSGDQGPLKRCPLFTQLGITAYPTVVLIDDKGQIVWGSTGLDERKLYELKMEIERRLPLTR
jgi:thiol-disulfide isomerase/thioredoxin